MSLKIKAPIAFSLVGFSVLLLTGCNSPGFCAKFPSSAGCQSSPGVTSDPSNPRSSNPSSSNTPHEPIDLKNGTIHFPVLYVIGTQPPSGGLSDVVLEIGPTSIGKLDIQFGGSGPNATGGLWQASAWMSAANVSFLLGDPMQGYKIDLTADVEGQIDGPSAGGITTAAILSVLKGDTIRSDVAMTGTINPDGTIGPVGGIEDKLDGAKKANKSIVLIPYEQKNQVISDQAHKLNLELQEVADIYEAYEALTGKALPRLPSLTDRVKISDKTEQQILQKAKDWKADYQLEKSKLSTIRRSSIPEISDAIDSLLDQGKASFQKAGSYEENGDYVGAYQEYSKAVSLIQSAADLARFFDVAENGSENEAQEQLENAWDSANSRIDSLLTRLQGLDPKTASDAIALTQAYSNLSIAQGLLDYAKETLHKSSSNEELGSALIWVVMSPALVNAQITDAGNLLDLGWGGSGSSLKVSKDQLKDFSNILKSAADANLAFIDNLLAEELSLTTQQIQQAFPSKDYEYGFARGTLKSLSALDNLTDQQKVYADLGSSLSSYYFSSQLVAKYYSLQAKLNDSNDIIRFERPRSLIFMLDSAEKRAEEVIGLAQKTGNNADLLVFSYEGAKLARSGTPNDQMNALGNLWYTTLSGKLMAIFAGEPLIPNR